MFFIARIVPASGCQGSANLDGGTILMQHSTNAQRAVASSFIKPGADVSGANELLLNLPERTRQTIAAVAGAGTLVVLKQAVVQGTTEDITDAVLKKLGLPLNVPTADATAYVMDGAPTMFMNAPAQKVPQGVLGSAQQALP